MSNTEAPLVHTQNKKHGAEVKMINRVIEQDLNKEFDIIVIGGGINGSGIARDAAERGLNVLLLEKDDFGSGCTSGSTRLIHGGLRYLEYFEFDLVRESLRERELLLRNANHLIKPIQILIPVYKDSKKNYLLIKLGMVLYDFLSFGKSLPVHKMLSRDEFMNSEPLVKNENLVGGAGYWDTQAQYPERICLENTIMASQKKAIVLNHAEVVEVKIEAGKVSYIEFVDSLTERKYKVFGKVVINSTGPWLDNLCGLMNVSIKRQLGGTIGSHIVIKRSDNGPKQAIYSSAKSDGRPFFIIPWRNYYLIGTTDIPYYGQLDKLKITEEEINYLTNEFNNIIAGANLKREDILFSYSGVRPLPYVQHYEDNPGKITRRYIIHEHREDGIQNLISILGGKLTTYRILSEKVVDIVFKKIGYDYVGCKTKIKPFIGCIDGDPERFTKQELKRFKRRNDIDPEIILHLISLYGRRYKEVLELTEVNQNLGRLLSSNSLDIRAQVVHAINKELAFTLSDILLRRTALGLSEGLGIDAIPQVIKHMQDLLGISKEEAEKQITDYTERVVKLRLVSL